MRSAVRLGELTVLLIALGASCTPSPGPQVASSTGLSTSAPPVPSAAPREAEPRALLVALVDGSVVALSVTGAAPPAPPRVIIGPGATTQGAHVLAIAPGGGTAYAMSPAALNAIDIANLTVRWTFPMPQGIGQARTLAVAPRTGDIYLFGNRGGSAVMARLDSGGHQVGDARMIKESSGLDWYAWQALISEDETIAAVSYHGTYTTGIDLVPLSGGPARVCPPRPGLPRDVCVNGHGGVAWFGDDLLVGTGGPPALRMALDGRLILEYDTRLVGNHLMEFAIDRTVRQLFAIGSCGYGGGLAVVDLVTNTTKVLAPPDRGAKPFICGERMELIGSAIVATNTLLPVPQLGGKGSVVFIDRATATPLRTVELAAEPVDILAVH